MPKHAGRRFASLVEGFRIEAAIGGTNYRA